VWGRADDDLAPAPVDRDAGPDHNSVADGADLQAAEHPKAEAEAVQHPAALEEVALLHLQMRASSGLPYK